MNLVKIEKKESIVEAASQLFRKFGYKKTSIKEICKEAGVSKTTFYKAFVDKSSVAIHLVTAHSKSIGTSADEIGKRNCRIEEKIEDLLKLHDQFVEVVGYDFLSEIMSISEDISQRLNQLFSKLEMNVAKTIRHGQRTGEIDKKIDVNFALCLLRKLHHLESDAELVAILPNNRKRSDQLIKIFYRGILGRP